MSIPEPVEPQAVSEDDEKFTASLMSFRVNNMVALPRSRIARNSGTNQEQPSSARSSVDLHVVSPPVTAAEPKPPAGDTNQSATSPTQRNSVSEEAKRNTSPAGSESSQRASLSSAKPPPSPSVEIDRFPDAFWKGWLRKKRVGTMGVKRRFVVLKPGRLEYYRDPNVRSNLSSLGPSNNKFLKNTPPFSVTHTQDLEPAGTIEFNNIGVAFDDKFTIIAPRGVFEFQAETDRDHLLWTKALSGVLSSINK